MINNPLSSVLGATISVTQTKSKSEANS